MSSAPKSYKFRLTYKGYKRYEELKNQETNISLNQLSDSLVRYTEASKQYRAALGKYNKVSLERDFLDGLRLSLECLVREILGNEKTLENQKEILGKYLKNNGVSDDIRNSFTTLLKHYTDFQNNNVKHHDKVKPEEIDFIKDQTESFMKHLIRVNERK